MSKVKLTPYMHEAGDDEVRAAELFARDLMRGDPLQGTRGCSAEDAAQAGVDALQVDLHQLAVDLFAARLEAWSEGCREARSPRGRIEDHALLRCPECCSEAVNSGDQSGKVRCGNCGERFGRGEAYVRVDEAEAFAVAPRWRRLKVLTPDADELARLFSEEGEEYDMSPLEAIPSRMERLLDELDAVVETGSSLTLYRDWGGDDCRPGRRR